MSIQICSCGTTFTMGTIDHGKNKVFRDCGGNAVSKCPKCGKELK